MVSYAKKAKRTYRKAKRIAGKVMRVADKVNNNKYVRGAATLYSLGQKVAMLSHLVNIEKKRFDVNTGFGLVNCGQINGSGVSGQYSAIVTPTPIEGIAQGQRIGLSLKLVSACMDIQFLQQASTVNQLKLRWFLVCRPDNSQLVSAATFINQFFEVNPFSNVNDYYSARDPEYFNAYKVIKTGTITLKQDQISSGNGNVQIKCPLKLNHHLKYNTDASTTTVKNQMYFFCVASGGDIFTGINTGASLQYNIRWYYTDN